MPARQTPKTSREKVARHRAKLRAQGLRPVTHWVRDTRTLEFKAEAHRQSLIVARSDYEAEDQAFIEAISEPWVE